MGFRKVRIFYILVAFVFLVGFQCTHSKKGNSIVISEIEIEQEVEEPLGVIKLYKEIENRLQYWETWDKDSETRIIHWGEVGTNGETREIKSELKTNYSNKIRKEIELKNSEGYFEFNKDNYVYLEIEYRIRGFGTKEDLDKRRRLGSKMDEVLSWTGLGHVDGGSIGDDTMEVGCEVVDYEIAKRIVEEALKNTEFENYSRIYEMTID